MAAEPKFFTKNLIDKGSVLTASTGQAVINRIFDRDRELLWKSSGSDDTTTETIQIDFKSGGIFILRDIDFLAVLGHNLKDFKFQHDVGAGFVDTPGAVTTTETLTFTLFNITKIPSVKSIKLVMNKTHTPVNGEKEVGEVLALEKLLEFPTDEAFAQYGFDFRPVVKITPMLDDGLIINQLRWAGNRVERYSSRVSFSLLPKALYDSLRSVVKRAVFTIQPEPDERPEEFFQVTHVQGGFPARYTSSFKGVGYNLDLTLREP